MSVKRSNINYQTKHAAHKTIQLVSKLSNITGKKELKKCKTNLK